MSSYLTERRALELLASAAGQYSGGDSSKAIQAMFDALERDYLNDLVECGIERVIELQVAIKQVRALRKVIAGQSADPRI